MANLYKQYSDNQRADDEYSSDIPIRKINDVSMKFDPELFATTVLPLFGAMEAIASKGKSPGTAALQQEQIWLEGARRRKEQEEREREQQEKAYQAAMERKLYGKMSEENLADPEGIKNVASMLLNKGSPAEARAFMELYQKATMPQSAGGKNGWAVRLAQGQAIDAMPEGPEKVEAQRRFARDWATSTWAGYQPETLEGAEEKARRTSAASQVGKAAGEQRVIESGQGTVSYDIADKLRNQFESSPEIKSLITANSNYKKAVDVYNKYKAGQVEPYEVDQSLGYFASKALDPNSVVMPGEFDRFAKGLGFQSVQAMSESLLRGGLKLTDQQRQGMFNIVERGMKSARETTRPIYEQYRTLAKTRGVNPDDITGSYGYLFPTPMNFRTAQEAESASNAGKIPVDAEILINGKHAGWQE